MSGYHPGRFESMAQARQWCEDYFDWYNFKHHHSGLAGFTPEQVFTGRYHEVARQKQQVLDSRFEKNPERFVKGRPHVKKLCDAFNLGTQVTNRC